MCPSHVEVKSITSDGEAMEVVHLQLSHNRVSNINRDQRAKEERNVYRN